MARPVYSITIVDLAPALANNYVVVPDGVRIILRDVDAYEESGTNGTVMSVQNAAGGNLVVFQRTAATPTGPWQWRGRQVYNPGESINFHVFSGTWSVMASGYELTLT